MSSNTLIHILKSYYRSVNDNVKDDYASELISSPQTSMIPTKVMTTLQKPARFIPTNHIGFHYFDQPPPWTSTDEAILVRHDNFLTLPFSCHQPSSNITEGVWVVEWKACLWADIMLSNTWEWAYNHKEDRHSAISRSRAWGLMLTAVPAGTILNKRALPNSPYPVLTSGNVLPKSLKSYDPGDGDIQQYFVDMLFDSDRNAQYARAIKRVIEDFKKDNEGKAPVVLDVGVGTGYLTACACVSGAEKVISVDVSKIHIRKLKKRLSPFTNVDPVLRKDYLKNPIPFDIMISEILGTCANSESAFKYLNEYAPYMKHHAGDRIYVVPSFVKETMRKCRSSMQTGVSIPMNVQFNIVDDEFFEESKDEMTLWNCHSHLDTRERDLEVIETDKESRRMQKIHQQLFEKGLKSYTRKQRKSRPVLPGFMNVTLLWKTMPSFMIDSESARQVVMQTTVYPIIDEFRDAGWNNTEEIWAVLPFLYSENRSRVEDIPLTLVPPRLSQKSNRFLTVGALVKLSSSLPSTSSEKRKR